MATHSLRVDSSFAKRRGDDFRAVSVFSGVCSGSTGSSSPDVSITSSMVKLGLASASGGGPKTFRILASSSELDDVCQSHKKAANNVKGSVNAIERNEFYKKSDMKGRRTLKERGSHSSPGEVPTRLPGSYC